MSTASAIIDVVRLRVDHSSLSDAQVLDIINDVQRDYQRRYPFRWQQVTPATITVATSTGALQQLALPTDAKTVQAIYAIVSGEHDLIEYQEDFFTLVDEMAGATSASQPSWWSQYGESAFLFPPLSSAISAQVFYEKFFADLTTTAQNSFTIHAADMLKDGATAEYYDSIGEMDKAQTYRARAELSATVLLKQQRATFERQRDPVAKVPGTLRRRKRTTYRGYTWW